MRRFLNKFVKLLFFRYIRILAVAVDTEFLFIRKNVNFSAHCEFDVVSSSSILRQYIIISSIRFTEQKRSFLFRKFRCLYLSFDSIETLQLELCAFLFVPFSTFTAPLTLQLKKSFMIMIDSLF